MIKKLFVFGGAALAVMLHASAAQAGTISCPGTAATNDREFSLTTPVTAMCLGWGPGNINGNNDPINQLGYVTIDKTDNSSPYVGANGELSTTPLNSGLSGTFSFVAPAGYHRFVLGFKSGQGQLDPDWVGFLLPSEVTSGSWAISSNQALSHVNLYGQACGGSTGVACDQQVPVPEPVSLVMLGLGLVGAAAARRRA